MAICTREWVNHVFFFFFFPCQSRILVSSVVLWGALCIFQVACFGVPLRLAARRSDKSPGTDYRAEPIARGNFPKETFVLFFIPSQFSYHKLYKTAKKKEQAIIISVTLFSQAIVAK